MILLVCLAVDASTKIVSQFAKKFPQKAVRIIEVSRSVNSYTAVLAPPKSVDPSPFVFAPYFSVTL